MTIITAIVLVLAGIVAGAVNSISGGGGLLTFPVLIAAGLSPVSASATDVVASPPGQVSSAWGYRKHFKKVPARYIWLLIPLVLGGLTGVTLLRLYHDQSFDQLAPYLVLSSVLLFALQPAFAKWRMRKFPTKARQVTGSEMIKLSIAVFAVAVYGGYFSIGLSLAALALLSYTRINSIHALNGSKNIVSAVVPLLSIGIIASTGLIAWEFGLILGAGKLIGGFVGARTAQYMNPRLVRILAIVIGLSTTGYLFLS